MLFKHPEFLYALLLLLIPIIVHLFHLRRFKTEAFTNVKFLKKVQLQTRRSSQLKKWLTLLARLLALAAIILAFTRPFIPHSEEALKEKETIIYIDNSFSMQQKGEQGELLKQAVQQVLQTVPEDMNLSILTNDQEFRNEPLSEIKNELLEIDYSPATANFKTTALKAKNLFSGRAETSKQFVAISDFQQKNLQDYPEFESDINVQFIQLKGGDQLNFSVDSVYIPTAETTASELEVKLGANRQNSQTLPVSLYGENGELIAKRSAGFEEDTTAVANFSLPEEANDLAGYIEIEDNSLKFDNTAFFSVQKPEKINIVALNSNTVDTQFLTRIYEKPEFSFTEMNLNELDYNKFDNANLILLNELETIPNGLENILEEHIENGGSITIIPSEKSDLKAYNDLLLHLQKGSFSDYQNNELKITSINFSHPLYADVFDGEVKNFQYPKVEGSFNYRSAAGNSILSFNNGRDFLTAQNHTYIFSAPLNSANSNFKQSPLIVPTFYNMAKQSLQLPQLSYTLGKSNTVMISTELERDEVLELNNDEESFIPQQRRYNNKVEITLLDLPEKAGTYHLLKNEEKKGHLSFNYDRAENQLIYSDLSMYPEADLNYNIKEFFTTEINKNEVDHLWKWFVIFAVIFLLIEVCLLKFLK